jgi:hypothetical protein
MNKQGFPRGIPAEDCQRLHLWWREEMQRLGLSGDVAIEPVRFDAHQQFAPGFGKQLFDLKHGCGEGYALKFSHYRCARIE